MRVEAIAIALSSAMLEVLQDSGRCSSPVGVASDTDGDDAEENEEALLTEPNGAESKADDANAEALAESAGVESNADGAGCAGGSKSALSLRQKETDKESQQCAPDAETRRHAYMWCQRGDCASAQRNVHAAQFFFLISRNNFRLRSSRSCGLCPVSDSEAE